MIVPLSGSNRVGGESMRNGVELAVKQINSDSGICGSRLDLIVYNNQGSSELTEKLDKDLIFLDNVRVIIGPSAARTAWRSRGWSTAAKCR